MSEKLCPMKLAGGTLYTNYNCDKKHCAWWVPAFEFHGVDQARTRSETEGFCAIKSLGEKMERDS